MASDDSVRRRQRGEEEGISCRPMCDSLLTLYALMSVSVFASLVLVKMANYDFDRDILGGDSVDSFLLDNQSDFWQSGSLTSNLLVAHHYSLFQPLKGDH